jgi:microcystin degradation protein MlrC
MGKKRIGIISLSHETHGFWGVPTRYEDFSRQAGDEILTANSGTRTCLAGFMEGLDKRQADVVPILSFQAMPAGRVLQESYCRMKEEILASLRAALPLDGLLVNLHGAMLAEGYEDCEGDIISSLRVWVGKTPIVATLDLHSNTSSLMVDKADALVIYQENPHVDKKERGMEAADILFKILGGAHLHKTHCKLPLLLSPLTTWTKGFPLMAGIRLAQEIRLIPGIINVGISGGYCYNDSDILGVSVLVYADARSVSQQECENYGRDIAQAIWQKRHTAHYAGFDLKQAVAKAACMSEGPVLLADLGDNIGGGAPGDGTILLEGLLNANVENALVVIADPESVDLAYRLGPGSRGCFNIGGKTDAFHGKTLALSCEVKALTDGKYQVGERSHFSGTFGNEVRMGRCAVLQSGGVTILVNETKTPPGGPEQLISQGFDPEHVNIIGAKSVIAFRGGYEAIAREIIEVNTAGICTCDLFSLPIIKNRGRLFPLNAEVKWPG